MSSAGRQLSLQSAYLAAGLVSASSSHHHQHQLQHHFNTTNSVSSSYPPPPACPLTLTSTYPASNPASTTSMAATLDGTMMMKLYSNQQQQAQLQSKLLGQVSGGEAYDSPVWSNGSSAYMIPVNNTKQQAFGSQHHQQSQPQQFQQLDQINFLVRKECCSEIDQAISELGISADPYNWSITDVQKWLLWMQRWIQLPHLALEHFQMDGMSLCSLTEDDFKRRAPNGEKLYAKLEIWRMAINYFRPEALIDTLFGSEGDDSAVQQRQQQNCLGSASSAYLGSSAQNTNYCASPYSSSGSSSSSADSISIYGSPISPEGYGVSSGSSGSGSSLPSYAESIYQSNAASPASPASSSHSSSHSMNCPSPYSMNQQQTQYGAAAYNQMPPSYSSNLKQQQQLIYATNQQQQLPTMLQVQPQQQMATSDYGSDAIPSDDDDLSDDEKCFIDYHNRVSLTHQQMQQQQQQLQSQNPMHQHRSLPVPVPQIKLENHEYHSPSASPLYQHQNQHQQHHHLHAQHAHFVAQQQQQQQQHRVQQQQNQIQQQQQYRTASSISVKSELPSSSITPIVCPPAAPVAPAPTVAPVRTTSSSHIHLWQFLKELLSQPHQFGSAIRWLDRGKGVFKIEDSVKVAKLWGARKNRPAMNYDKLSRSIRQYYKKGIMKKTERSQRLVYQFCTPYSL